MTKTMNIALLLVVVGLAAGCARQAAVTEAPEGLYFTTIDIPFTPPCPTNSHLGTDGRCQCDANAVHTDGIDLGIVCQPCKPNSHRVNNVCLCDAGFKDVGFTSDGREVCEASCRANSHSSASSNGCVCDVDAGLSLTEDGVTTLLTCTPCNPGSHTNVTPHFCDCDPGLVTLGQDTVRNVICGCPEGTFDLNNGAGAPYCVACPDAASCPAGTTGNMLTASGFFHGSG